MSCDETRGIGAGQVVRGDARWVQGDYCACQTLVIVSLSMKSQSRRRSVAKDGDVKGVCGMDGGVA